MSKKKLSDSFSEQLQRLDLDDVKPQHGTARPIGARKNETGLWIAWHLQDVEPGYERFNMNRALNCALSPALEDYFSAEDPTLEATSSIRQLHSSTEILTKLDVDYVVGELATIMHVKLVKTNDSLPLIG